MRKCSQNLSGHVIFLKCSFLMVLKVFATDIDLFRFYSFSWVSFYNLSSLRKSFILSDFLIPCIDLCFVHRKFLQLSKSFFVILPLFSLSILYILIYPDFSAFQRFVNDIGICKENFFKIYFSVLLILLGFINLFLDSQISCYCFCRFVSYSFLIFNSILSSLFSFFLIMKKLRLWYFPVPIGFNCGVLIVFIF